MNIVEKREVIVVVNPIPTLQSEILNDDFTKFWPYVWDVLHVVATMLLNEFFLKNNENLV